jgi:Tol biopolymer transport system component
MTPSGKYLRLFLILSLGTFLLLLSSQWKIPRDRLIGYTVLRTNLPGGRQANVSTMRAMVVNSDGSGSRVLAGELVQGTDSMTQFAGWSPDGKSAILGRGWKSTENAKWEEEHKQFRNIEGEVLYDNCLFDISTGKVTNVTAVERISCYNSGLFYWPGDSTKLGFTALIKDISHPFSMDKDGRNKTDLTKGSKDFTYGFNASRDGSKIAYHKDYQIYIANADGSDAIHVNTGQPFNFGPQWSPDGKRILFLCGERNIKCNPYLVMSNGTGLKKLADRGGYKGSIQFLDVYDFHEGSSDVPVWAADGNSVFYTALIGKTVELFQIDLDGNTLQLTKSSDGTLHYHPEPSPDGKWLLYGSKRDGIRQIYVMRLSDHTEKRITNLKQGYGAMWAHWQP